MLMKIRPPFLPELLPEVQEKIDDFLNAVDGDARVLELGAGFSTLWFARSAGVRVVSLETDYAWWREVNEALEKHDLEPDVDVWLVGPEEMVPVIKDFPDGHFDLVLVDCVDEMRQPCFLAAMRKVRPGGWLVLDDTHWPALQPLMADLSPERGWPQETVKGRHVRHTGVEHYHQTTFFRKPA